MHTLLIVYLVLIIVSFKVIFVPYEIPQNLKYKEKIAFGLTIEQLFWLGVFGACAGVVFFKAPLGLVPKTIVSMLFMLFGVGFGFFDLLGHIKTYSNYRKSIGEAGYLDKRLQEFVEVKKIENNAIYLKNGSLRAVVEVTPINFGILSPEEQRAVIHAYKEFLNSLDFPVQIVMRTTNLNVDEYLLDLKKNTMGLNNAELEKQFESFKEFVQGFIKENDVKNRLFYVVVPYSAYSNAKPLKDAIVCLQGLFSGKRVKGTLEMNRETALNQLNIRAKLCEEKLKKCGLFVRHLTDAQLLSLISSFFDSFIHAEGEYFFPMTMAQKFEGGRQDA